MDRAQLQRELFAIGATLLAVFIFGALVFQRVPDGASCLEAKGLFGPAGTYVRCALVSTVGIPGAALVAAGFLAVALVLFGRWKALSNERHELAILFTGLVLLVPVIIGLAKGGLREVTTATGLWGSFVAYYLREGFGPGGAWLAVGLLISVLTVVTLRWNPLRVLLGPSVPRPNANAEHAHTRTLAEELEPEPEELPSVDPAGIRELLDEPVPVRSSPARTESTNDGKRQRKGKTAVVQTEADLFGDTARGETPAFADELPPLDLLTPGTSKTSDANRRDLDAAGEKLMATLRTFRVEGELVGRTTGPTVTQYEIEPAAGVKVRQIAALADDLALAMRAPSIRIVAPIPGRGAVGVEVPNPTPEIVLLRDVLESREFQQARAALPIALGKNLEGEPVVADLARMPHLLIAGATGSGKSVCVNTIITSLVYRHTPKTLRFLMVDPKMVELSVYNSLPHLRHKVITDNRDAASVLKWAVMEMQERYRLLEANTCRNLQEFNRRVQQYHSGEGPAPQKPRTPDVAFEDRTYTGNILPYIVVVIDEMADLMMTVQGEVETPIAMLAQKARAVGIHLILATQRPSVNVITGLIKANFPCRIAFRVAQQVDSRTIIDGAGAEALLGNGDMLFIPPGKSEAARLQGAFLSSEDTERLLQWYEAARARQLAELAQESDEEPDILETVRALEAKASDGDDDSDNPSGERDARFREAAEVVIQHRQGSTSLLQRRLKIGYGRAARIIDQLEEAGVLAPSEGSARPRDVLVGMQDLDRICGS